MLRNLVSTEDLSEFDRMYEARLPSGQPTSWRILVEELRKIRRTVEAATVVQIDHPWIRDDNS